MLFLPPFLAFRHSDVLGFSFFGSHLYRSQADLRDFVRNCIHPVLSSNKVEEAIVNLVCKKLKFFHEFCGVSCLHCCFFCFFITLSLCHTQIREPPGGQHRAQGSPAEAE